MSVYIHAYTTMDGVTFLRNAPVVAPAGTPVAPPPATILQTVVGDVEGVVRAVENAPVVKLIETGVEKAAHFMHTEISALAKKCEANPEFQHALQSVHRMKAYVVDVYARARAEGHKITEEIHNVFVNGLRAFLVHTEHSIHQFAVEAVSKFDNWVFGGVSAMERLVNAADP